jgi:hypothetical protein
MDAGLLREEPRPDPPLFFIHHGRQSWSRIRHVPALHAGARSRLKNGIKPKLHKGKHDLDLILGLLLLYTACTTHPPRRRPAEPPERREERARTARKATLNGRRKREEGEERKGKVSSPPNSLSKLECGPIVCSLLQ